MIVSAVATNVITGFLGAGKTTFINALLQAKPADETWAVLVNEFGEIGIDGSLLPQQQAGIVIREVAGGCLCCAAGVPLQVAVTQLLAKAKPQRLLIEPTGLGHPLQILQTLQSAHFAQAIRLQSCVCLLDPRKLTDARYRQHDTFRAQLTSADLLLASKADLWQQDSALTEVLAQFLQQFPDKPLHYWHRQTPLPGALLTMLKQPHVTTVSRAVVSAKVPRALASASSLHTPLLGAASILDWQADSAQPTPTFDERGLVFSSQQQAEACSYGWIFSPERLFALAPLYHWIQAQSLLRLKAVMITTDGIAAFNMLDGELTVAELEDAMDSRLEIISREPLDASLIEQQLLALLEPQA